MFIYDIKDINLLLERDETEIISCIIGPIKRKQYMFICYEKDGNPYLKFSEYSHKELFEFGREFYKMSMPVSLEKVIKEDSFIEAYKRKFVRVAEIKNSTFVGLLKQVSNVDIDAWKRNIKGLDGFSLDCYMPIWDKNLCMWCVIADEYFRPVVDLANFLLDFMMVDLEYRFRIIPY